MTNRTPLTSHELFDAGGDDGNGYSRWKQCRICGATFHAGHWWLAGYQSTESPPCLRNPIGNTKYLRWQAQAKNVHVKQSQYKNMENENVR